MNILAIESSCDETSVAVIRNGTEILSNVVASSTLMHEKWGGIVPEVAAREQLESIIPVLTEALSSLSHQPSASSYQTIIKNSIDAIAITVGPGLIGSLLIGIETAKAIAFVTEKPIIPVNHVLAHMYANFLNSRQLSAVSSQTENSLGNNKIVFPAISLVVSGGHTELFLMKNKKDISWLGGTIDDAAGEAFDKSARLLGFGHGGGLAIQKAAKEAIGRQSSAIRLPRPIIHDDTLNFSFSGLKTAVMREWKNSTNHNEQMISAFSYEIQEAITDVLVKKTLKAVQVHNAQSILISGGVASNLRLREKMNEAISHQPSARLAPKRAISFYSPPIEFCTDNAAYIGSYAYFRGTPVDWHEINAIPDLSVEV